MYVNAHIHQYVFKTKVLFKPQDILSGMMGKQFTKSFDALLFVMDDSSSSFWMKNCIVPLDVLFIKNNKITKIHHNCPPCKSTNEPCKRYNGTGNLVMEMPGGTCKRLDIKKGDAVSFLK
jgi:uncharacterized membrane protein (UPF0127 family)